LHAIDVLLVQEDLVVVEFPGYDEPLLVLGRYIIISVSAITKIKQLTMPPYFLLMADAGLPASTDAIGGAFWYVSFIS
jgi:hypothetical protein